MLIIPYTVNVGNYDIPQEGILCFTDYDRFIYPERNARIYSILPHKFMECDVSVFISGAVKVKVPFEQLVEEWLGEYDIAMFRHPWRDCVHQEAIAAEGQIRHDDELVILHEQQAHYRLVGIPEHIGTLPETGIMIRRHNRIVKQFCEAWWAEMCRWSYRDQVSFPVVLREFPELKVNYITPDVRTHPYTELKEHI